MAIKKSGGSGSTSRSKVSRKAQKMQTSGRKGAIAKQTGPGDELRIAITFPSPGDQPGPVATGARMSAGLVRSLVPEERSVGRAIERLQRAGFRITTRGRLTASARTSRKNFEKIFGTKLDEFKLDKSLAINCQARSFYYPGQDAAWNPDPEVKSLIDEAYIQWPHIYLNQRFPMPPPSPIPPRIDYHHLRVPGDLNILLNVPEVHRAGTTGRGVTVAMVDSGFAHGHTYFTEQGYRTTTVLAPGATHVDRDGNGHGTGESANLLAVAPDVNFVGVKLDNETNASNGASLLEGFQEALSHNPQVISVSIGFDLCPTNFLGQRISNDHLTQLPNSLVALEAEVEAAVDAGVVVVFSAGNGHVAFPGMMPQVISAGGVFVEEDGSMHASDYASAFTSKIYPGRIVPDFSGLVGEAANGAHYIMLPVDPGGELDQQGDGTLAGEGWGVFSGTSAAAPQLAGVCALLLEKDSSLTPGEVKSVLRRSSRDVVLGSSNGASNENNGPIPAGFGNDGATGAGLVDAFEAWKQV
ncbi:MAG: S8 family serine peptidase [Pseudomonadota bacterium]